jgi:hypothetical protein
MNLFFLVHNKYLLVLLATTTSRKPSAILKTEYLFSYKFYSIL